MQQQLVKDAVAVGRQAGDFSVQNRSVHPEVCAIFSASFGDELNVWPFQETNSQGWPHTNASARQPWIFDSNTNSGWSKGSGIRSSRMGGTTCSGTSTILSRPTTYKKLDPRRSAHVSNVPSVGQHESEMPVHIAPPWAILECELRIVLKERAH